MFNDLHSFGLSLEWSGFDFSVLPFWQLWQFGLNVLDSYQFHKVAKQVWYDGFNQPQPF